MSCRVCGKQKGVLRTAGPWQSSQSSSPGAAPPQGLASPGSAGVPGVASPSHGLFSCLQTSQIFSSSLYSCSLFHRTLRGPEACPHPVSCPLQPVPRVISQISAFPISQGCRASSALAYKTWPGHPLVSSPITISFTHPALCSLGPSCLPPPQSQLAAPFSYPPKHRSNNISSQNSQPPSSLSHHLLRYSWNSIS